MNRRSFLISSILASTVHALGLKDACANTNEAPITRLSLLHPRLANQGWVSLPFDKGLDGKPLQIGSRTFDGRLQLVEYKPTVLDRPPNSN